MAQLTTGEKYVSEWGIGNTLGFEGLRFDDNFQVDENR